VTDRVHQAAGAIKTKIVKFRNTVAKIGLKPFTWTYQIEIP
jgi:hypothetical protein